MIKTFTSISLLVFALIFSTQAQQIARKGKFGAAMSNLNDSIAKSENLPDSKGLLITTVAEGYTAYAMKIKPGDIIRKINNQSIENTKDGVALLRSLREKDKIEIELVRKTKSKKLKGIVVAADKEKYDNLDVVYDEFAFKNGYIRTILTKPKGATNLPVILFIPGFYCYSLDNIGAGHPYSQLVKGLTEKGYAVMRIEKSGTGDCMNTPLCDTMDFVTEAENFRLGLEKVKSYNFIDTSKIILWGHSLGGIIAPVIANQSHVAGIVAFGSNVTNWYTYLLNLMHYQPSFYKANYVATEQAMPGYISVFYQYLIEKKSPSELAKNEEYNEILKNQMMYDGKNSLWTRDYKFWQQIQDQNLYSAWVNSKAKVLIMQGEFDMESFDQRQGQAIVDCINDANPDHAQQLVVPQTNHSFVKVNSYKHGLEIDRKYMYENFNTNVVDETDKWIRENILK